MPFYRQTSIIFICFLFLLSRMGRFKLVAYNYRAQDYMEGWLLVRKDGKYGYLPDDTLKQSIFKVEN